MNFQNLSNSLKAFKASLEISIVLVGAMRLLVVEDNAQLSQLLGKGLGMAGYDTDLLATVADARAALMTTSYAALILDLGLPDGDGLSVLRELRHRKDPIPVLVLTARGGLDDRVKGSAQRSR